VAITNDGVKWDVNVRLPGCANKSEMIRPVSALLRFGFMARASSIQTGRHVVPATFSVSLASSKPRWNIFPGVGKACSTLTFPFSMWSTISATFQQSNGKAA
jgi:hypothetical protein